MNQLPPNSLVITDNNGNPIASMPCPNPTPENLRAAAEDIAEELESIEQMTC